VRKIFFIFFVMILCYDAIMDMVLAQPTLIDEPNYRAMSVTYVPETNVFQMPDDPLKFEGYKLQQFLLGMEKVRETMPGQFNAAIYKKTLSELMAIIKQIKERDDADFATPDIHSGGVGEISPGGDPPEVGERELAELDLGISTKNPFSR
jgi:hypothetical protein